MKSNLAIIILNYSSYELTEKCVDNLISLGVEHNILIVDNDSPNKSFEVLEKKYETINNIYVIKNSINSGYSGGNNFGIKYIMKLIPEVKYICVMNPDTIVTYKEIFTNLISKIDTRKDIVIISPIQIYNNVYDSSHACWNIPKSKEIVLNHSIILRKIFHNKAIMDIDTIDSSIAIAEVVPGSFFIIKMDEFIEVGLFDENTFLYNEENILAIKLKNRGYKEAISVYDCYHHNHLQKNQKLANSYKISIAGFRSRLYLCRKYYSSLLVMLLCLIQLLVFVEIFLFHSKNKLKQSFLK